MVTKAVLKTRAELERKLRQLNLSYALCHITPLLAVFHSKQLVGMTLFLYPLSSILYLIIYYYLKSKVLDEMERLILFSRGGSNIFVYVFHKVSIYILLIPIVFILLDLAGFLEPNN